MDYDHSERKRNAQNVLMTEYAAWGSEMNAPKVDPLPELDTEGLRMVTCFRMAQERHPETCILNFCADDYIFERIWQTPRKYLDVLRRFAAVTMPDFSMYYDWPRALNVYNHWRNHTLARFWQDEGITVIPAPGFTTWDEFSWQFESFPKDSVVFLSSLGVTKDPACRKRFNDGYAHLMRKCMPKKVLLYGRDIREARYKTKYGDVILFPFEKEVRTNG